MKFSCVHKQFVLLREAISHNKHTNLCIEFSHFLFKAFQQIRILLSTASTQFLFVDIFTIIFLVLKNEEEKVEAHLLFTSKSVTLRTCLHGGRGPQVSEVTHSGGVTRLSI